MAGRIVRASKFRNVFGTVPKKEQCYDNLKVSRSAWDSNKIKVNTKFFAVLWEASGGGAFAVIPHEEKGKVKADLPLVCGHKAEVLDVDFNPFNEFLVASASEDAYVKIWSIPEGGFKQSATNAAQTLSGHKRKVGTCDFHPFANNVLATTGSDFECRFWDIEKAKSTVVAGHSDIIQAAAWSYDGQTFATTCKDRKMRIVDPRGNKIVAEKEAHAGSKGSRVIYLGKSGHLFSVGFSKTSSRQYSVWDPRNLENPVFSEDIDTAAGMLMPVFDHDLNILYLAGKGDGNIRYYEVTSDHDKPIYFLSEYKSNVPQRGVGALPKRACDVTTCEVARIYKISGDGKMVEPISFQVPRKSDQFQDDIYPDTFSGEPTVTADAWFGGANGEQKTVKLGAGFVAKAKPQEFKPEAQEDEGPKTEKELREDWEKLKKRVAYLEAEVARRDARIKELEAKP
jgi:coronin-1B/1C/6